MKNELQSKALEIVNAEGKLLDLIETVYDKLQANPDPEFLEAVTENLSNIEKFI